MKHIRKYSDFRIIESLNNIDDRELFVDIFQSYWDSPSSKILTKSEKRILDSEFKRLTESLNESFFDTLKNRYDKAKLVATEFSDNAKSALKKLLDASKSALDFIKWIKDKLMESINSMITTTKESIMNKLKGDSKLISIIKEKMESEKDNLVKDLKVCSDVVKFYKEKMTGSLLSKVEVGVKEVLVGSDQPVTESLILEGDNNVISKLFHGIEHIAPFSWLHEVQKAGERGATFIIKALSGFTEKLGGPSFVLPVIASILGIAFEMNVKGLSKQGLLNVVEFFSIPFVSWIIKIVGWVATFIAVTDLVDEIFGSKAVRDDSNQLH